MAILVFQIKITILICLFIFQIDDIESLISKKTKGIDEIASSCMETNTMEPISSNVCLLHSSLAKIDLLKHQYKQLQEIRNTKNEKYYGCRIQSNKDDTRVLEDLQKMIEKIDKDKETLTKIGDKYKKLKDDHVRKFMKGKKMRKNKTQTEEDEKKYIAEDFELEEFIIEGFTLRYFDIHLEEVFKKFDEVI